MVEGYIKSNENLPTIMELYDLYMGKGIDEKEVLKTIAVELNISKKEVYQKVKIDK